jgi:large subunit ribosomal protein L13
MKPRIIDADGLVLGRLASKVAKILLLGQKVIIVNAERAIISGRKRQTITRYKDRLHIKTHYNPIKGPFWYKIPNQIVRRTVRGMLPWKNQRGKRAYKNLKVFMGIPEDLTIDKDQIETYEEISLETVKGSYIEISALAKEIGYKY